MSNLVFPTSVPGGFNWTWPLKKTPSYKTIEQPTVNNRGELRISLTPYPIWMFDMNLAYIKGSMMNANSYIQQIIGFFASVNGAAQDWLFQDPFDYSTDTYLALVNPDFESSISLPPFNWTVGSLGLSSNCTLSYDTATQYAGNRSLVVNAAAHNAGVTMQQTFPVIPGQTYQLWGAMKSLSADQCNINFSFFSSSNSLLGSVAISTTSASWKYLTAQATVPATSTYATLQCYMSGASGGNGEFDAMSVALINPQAIAVGDGATKVFPMVRILPNGGFDLIQNFIQPPNIYLAGSVASPSSYSLDAFGNLTFTTAPASSTVIAWNGNFYFRCRFIEDQLEEMQQFMKDYWECSSLKFKSVLF